MPRLRPAALALALLSAPAAGRAELVVFEDGRVVKAASYQVRGSEVEIRLPGGGSYSVDLDRVERIVDDAIAENKATSMRDMGRVMADVMPQIAGRADGSAVSQLVREKLA